MACNAVYGGEPLIESKYLAAVDLGDEPKGYYIQAINKKVKIKSARGTDIKPTFQLKGVEKEWVLNTTNLNFLAEAYGDPEATNWIGYPVVLVAMRVMGSEGKMVPSIRVDPVHTRNAFKKMQASRAQPKQPVSPPMSDAERDALMDQMPPPMSEPGANG